MFASEVSGIINKKIDKIKGFGDKYEVGTVMSVADGVVKIYGLDKAFYGEVVVFDKNVKGMIVSLREEYLSVVVLGDYKTIREGDSVKRTKELCSVPVGEGLLGRVVNPLGEPLDDKGPIEFSAKSPIERDAPGIISRKSVHEPLQTGIKSIDLLIPIGKGQRELIIGDRGSGKSSVALDTIINQKQFHEHGKENEKVYCIYVAIGQKKASITRFMKSLEDVDALKYSVIVSASSSDAASLQFIAPYAGCAIAEYFRDNGKHALTVYDDLSKHAVAYREMALLLKRPPGREAYPGDVFYIHSRLLERAAKLSQGKGGGSLTSIPIIETQEGDISAYIPTNVISITDGQIFLDKELFNSGFRPAVDIGLSVSRVGSAAQCKIIKGVASSLKLEIANFLELKSFARFSSDLDKNTRKVIDRGNIITEALKQDIMDPQTVEMQFLTIYLCNIGALNKVNLQSLRSVVKSFLDDSEDLLVAIKATGAMTDELALKIGKAVENANFGSKVGE